MKRLNRMRWLPLAILLGLATLMPTRASAQAGTQWVNQLQCVDAFLAACATLHYVEFTNSGPAGRGVLSIMVSNTSDAAVELGAYIRQLALDLNGILPAVQAMANAQYGVWDAYQNAFTATPGDQENWKAKTAQKTPSGLPDSFQLDLAVKDDVKDDRGGRKDRIAGVGEAVMITVNFDEAFGADVGLACPDPNVCQGWSAEMKGLGADGKGHGFTTTPEPATLLLFASGLLGLAGVQSVRRRRRRDPSE